MSFKDLSPWKKGGVIGFLIWVLLGLIFYVSGLFMTCSLPTDEFGIPPDGMACWNSIQSIIITILFFLSLPFTMIGATPNESTAGPLMVKLFWIGSAISLALWGMLIGWIYGKIKKKN
tara:strand:- start:1045 stop:1398 length:354 start_codon:yes stop_codon:yes gene_type:complete